MIAIPVLIGAVIAKKMNNDELLVKDIGSLIINQKIFTIFFFIFFTLSLVAIIESLQYWYSIFIIGALMSIFIHIVSKNYHPNLIILEIILLLSNQIFSSVLLSPFYFGWTDIFNHLHYSHIISITSHLIPADLDLAYANFPLYHILVAENAMICGLEIKQALFTATCPVYLICIIFIYHIAHKYTNNQQISLFTCIAFAASPIVIFYGKYIVTRSLAFVASILILYILYNIKTINRTIPFNIILVIFSVFLILIHQVSIVQIVALLGILVSLEYILSTEKYINLPFYAFIIVLFLSYWFFVAFDFVKSLKDFYIEAGIAGTPIFVPDPTSYNPQIFLIGNLEILIFLLFATVGISYIFYSQKPFYLTVLAFFAIFAIFLYVPNPLLSIWQFTELLRSDRFSLLISPFIALIMACGMYAMISHLTMKNNSLKYALIPVFALFLIYCIGSSNIMPVYQDASREEFNYDELTALQTIEAHVPYGSILYSDYYIQRYFNKDNFTSAKYYGIPYYSSYVIEDANTVSNKNGLFIIAQEQFQKSGLRFDRKGWLNPEGNLYTFLPSVENMQLLNQELNKNNKLYSNKAIEMFS